MLKANRKFTVILSFVGSFISLAALLIFMLLPSSDFANSVYRPSTDALYLFMVTPVLSLIGSAFNLCAFIKNFKALSLSLTKPIVWCGIALYAAIAVFNTVLYLSYTIKQFSLGFVAPFGGTVYESLAVIAAVGVFHQFFLSVMTAASNKK